MERKKFICLISLFVISVNFLFSSGPAAYAETKIAVSLIAQLDNMQQDEATDVMVWFPSIDNSALVSSTIDETGINPEKTMSAQTYSADEIQTFIEAKRAEAREQYTKQNSEYAEKYLSGKEILYISQYSPVVVATLEKSDIYTLTKSDDVLMISPYENINNAELNISIPVIRADSVKSQGYTGEGVKIGMLDLGIPNLNASQLTSANIQIRTGDTEVNVHSTFIASILAGQATTLYPYSGIAPDASLYCTYIHTGETYLEPIEWLLNQGVNVINASIDFGNDAYNTYGSTALWVDHIAFNHDVHFVKSAGNTGASGITSPGMACNIITVGNINDKNTVDRFDDEIYSTSSYISGDILNLSGVKARKPDFCAPGTNISAYGTQGTGTSASAAHVTGTIAQLCEKRPEVKYQQAAMKAILAAGVNRDTLHIYRPEDNNYRYYGSGLIDAHVSCWITGDVRYRTGNIGQYETSKSYTMYVSPDDSQMRVALAYHKYVQFTSSHTGTPDINHELQNLTLTVRNPSGTVVGYTEIEKANIKVITFPVNGVSGNYTITVTKKNPSAGATTISVAWR